LPGGCHPLVNIFRVHICAALVEDFKAWAFSLSVSNYTQSRLASSLSHAPCLSLFSDTDTDTHTLGFKVCPGFGFPPSQARAQAQYQVLAQPNTALVLAQIPMSTPILLTVTQFPLSGIRSNGSKSNRIHG